MNGRDDGNGIEPTATCPVCGDAIGPAPTYCPACDTPHHWDCWEYNGGCAVYSCPRKVRPRRRTSPTPTATDEKATSSVVALHPAVAFEPVPPEHWTTYLPVDDVWVGFELAWVFAIVLFLGAEMVGLALLLICLILAAVAWHLLPALLVRPVFTVDFSTASVGWCRHVPGCRPKTDVWALFSELEYVAVQWTSTSGGPRLELVAKRSDGLPRPLTPPFEPEGTEADRVALVIATFVTATDVPVRGKGNLGNALRRALGHEQLLPM